MKLLVRLVCSIVPSIVVMSLATGQEAPRRRAVVEPAEGFQLTNRIAFLLDVSGSMHPAERFGDALGALNEIADGPTDDLEIAVWAFTDTFERWPGRPEPDAARPVPPGWARLPSQETLGALHEWIRARARSGGTNPVYALRSALSERRPGTTIVMITDGEFWSQQLTNALVAERADREAEGLPGISVVILRVAGQEEPGAGIAPPDPSRPSGITMPEELAIFAKVAGGGLWQLEAGAPPEPTTEGPW